MDCTILVTKTKVTAKLICAFVFAYVKTQFSHDAAHITQLIYIYIFIIRCDIYLASARDWLSAAYREIVIQLFCIVVYMV